MFVVLLVSLPSLLSSQRAARFVVNAGRIKKIELSFSGKSPLRRRGRKFFSPFCLSPSSAPPLFTPLSKKKKLVLSPRGLVFRMQSALSGRALSAAPSRSTQPVRWNPKRSFGSPCRNEGDGALEKKKTCRRRRGFSTKSASTDDETLILDRTVSPSSRPQLPLLPRDRRTSVVVGCAERGICSIHAREELECEAQKRQKSDVFFCLFEGIGG